MSVEGQVSVFHLPNGLNLTATVVTTTTTGSPVPLSGLVGLIAFSAGLMLRIRRLYLYYPARQQV